ncbi:MAG: glycosyltransferase [Anaerolineae bacterium]|nr:glycosyltransferase [Anaerolineae bacterium]
MITSSYPRYAGDGAGSFVASLAQSLVAAGHQVAVVAPYDPFVAPWDTQGVEVYRFRYAPFDALHVAGHGQALLADVRMKRVVPWLMPGFVIAALWRVWRLHQQRPFAVFHGHWAVPGGVVAALAAEGLKVPMLLSLHGSDVYVLEHNALYRKVAQLAFRRAARIVACSEDLRRRAVALGAEERKTLVLPYGVDGPRYALGKGERLRRLWGIPGGALVIGALGRLVYKKGFDVLLTAFARVAAQMPEAFCVIGGEGDLRQELERKAQQLGIARRVLFPGRIPWGQTPDFYALCDVFVVPSVVDRKGNVDGLPNVLLEAMASARALVASRVAGIPEVVEEGKNGLLVPPGDAQALGEALLRLLGDLSLRQRLGREARRTVATRYTWEGIAQEYLQLYAQADACMAEYKDA